MKKINILVILAATICLTTAHAVASSKMGKIARQEMQRHAQEMASARARFASHRYKRVEKQTGLKKFLNTMAKYPILASAWSGYFFMGAIVPAAYVFENTREKIEALDKQYKAQVTAVGNNEHGADISAIFDE